MRNFHCYTRRIDRLPVSGEKYPPPRPFPVSRQFYGGSLSWAEETAEAAIAAVKRYAETAFTNGALEVDVEIVEMRCYDCCDGVRRDKLGRKMRKPCACVALGGPVASRWEKTFSKKQEPEPALSPA